MYVDMSSMAPDVFVTAPIGKWDPWLYLFIDEWWDHAVYGKPYSSPEGEITFTMRDGTCDLSPISEDLVPDEVIDSVMEISQKIMDGELVIGANYAPPESD
jgi:basic membrane lipoprotein Med (substrate-binding protein (PBP1-ABC) superfamily)